MKKQLKVIKEDLTGLMKEQELLEKANHKTAGRVHLWARNICVGIATVLFLLSFLVPAWHSQFRGIAYFFGAGAYLSELSMLTDKFTKKVPYKELFMVYCFGPLYFLMGLAYLLE